MKAIGWSGGMVTVAAGAGAPAVPAEAAALVDAADAEVDGFCEVVLLHPDTTMAAPTASAIGVIKCLCIEKSFVSRSQVAAMPEARSPGP
ncbi:MAG TPA: hypothetical protein VFS86_05235 [Rhodanobacteraceae bacterium]|nr:hypothetical protein [Rhodanobacteraceae bacterium]